jgi:hypothetical protein
MTTIILGKNSKLYSKLREYYKPLGLIESSHKDTDSIEKADVIIVFSFDPKVFDSNRRLLDKLLLKNPKKLIYISTTAIYSNKTTRGYKYPRIKKEIENYLFQFENVHIIRVGMVEGFFNPDKFVGNIKYTSLDHLSKTLEEVANNKTNLKVSETWVCNSIQGNNRTRKVVYTLLIILKKSLKSKFHYTRPLDIILKLFGEQNYGYTFLSNNLDVHSKYTIVGSGMAALGTLKGIEEKNELNKTHLIHSKTSNIKYYESSEKPIESLSNGGNSNIWHSVISRFSYQKNITQASSKFFNELFPNSAKSKGLTSYSFIPFFPIRPLKKIQKKKKELKELIDDTILYVEKDKFDRVLIHGNKSSYSTENLFLCTGSISSLKLLSDSGIIKTSNSSVSEHLVGYFGQFAGFLKDQVIRTREGHFKKFHRIKLDKRSLYVTLRPANFSFKNIEKANEFRDFFGTSSKSIITSLFSKFKMGLILEALYNKFGLEFNFSGTYNIVGHIESINTVNIKCPSFKRPNIIYNEKEVHFNEEEIKSIKQYLRKIGITGTITINKKTSVSPGIHFLNSNLKDELLNLPKGIRLYSTILFDNESPKHPTFDLYASSYLSTINSLK